MYNSLRKEEFFSFSGNHIEKIGYNGGAYIQPGYFKDEFGVLWNRSGGDDIGVVEHHLIKEPDVASFAIPKVDPAEIKQLTETVLSNGNDSFKLAKIGMLLFPSDVPPENIIAMIETLNQ